MQTQTQIHAWLQGKQVWTYTTQKQTQGPKRKRTQMEAQEVENWQLSPGFR